MEGLLTFFGDFIDWFINDCLLNLLVFFDVSLFGEYEEIFGASPWLLLIPVALFLLGGAVGIFCRLLRRS